MTDTLVSDYPEIPISDLTEVSTTGNGVFDQLMQATKQHLEQEYNKGRIKGPEYSQVYLGSIQAVMDRSLQFLIQQQTAHLEAQLLAEQVQGQKKQNALLEQQQLNAEAQKLQIDAQTDQIQSQTALTDQQKINTTAEKLQIDQQTSNLEAEALNIPKQGQQIDAQTSLTTQQEAKAVAEKLQIDQQTSNLQAEALNIPKQGVVLDKQVEQASAEIARIDAQQGLITQQIATEIKQNELNGLLDQQKAQLIAQTAQTEQQTTNLLAEELNIPKQGAVLDAQETQTQQQTSNLEAEALNIPKQGELIDKQVCKLNAEFDLISEQVLKATQETSLLAQKKVTEKAQTDSTGIDPESVIGKQKQLYGAQTKGYGQDARNKAAKLLVDTWNVRRTTDSGTVAGYDEEEGGTDNKLGDKDIAAAIDRMSEGL